MVSRFYSKHAMGIMFKRFWSHCPFLLLWGLTASNAHGQWIAFNDYATGLGTHSNATTFGPTLTSGALKNISTGVGVGVNVAVTSSGVVNGAVQSVPDYGTPAFVVFDGFVTFAGAPNPGIELDTAADFITYTFSGLDPNSEYNFQGTAMRGNSAYTDRWSLFEITGAASFSSRHSAGALTTAQVPALTPSQVAINTGFNSQGVLTWWEHIRPAGNGTFAVVSTQYKGTVPGGTSAGVKGYGITGFRLEKAAVYSGRTNVPPRLPNLEPAAINGIRNIFVIMMENHDWSTIKASSFCPYINNTLLPMASYTTQYYTPPGNHPSEPNYLWLICGTNFGIHDDNPPAINHQSSTRNLFNQMDAAGISWKCYAEDITGTTCPDADSGEYGVRHNPFVFFDSVRNNLNYCTNHNRPYPELARDLTNNTAPRFSFIVPNVTNDMHDLTPGSPSTRAQGDTWLAAEVPKILNSQAYLNGGALFITFDEGSADGDGPIGMMVISARAKGAGYSNNVPYSHSSTLRTWQDIFHLGPYLADAAYATSLVDLFKTIRLTSAKHVAGNMQLVFTNLVVGKTNFIQASATLDSNSWVNVKTNVSSSTGFQYAEPATNNTRFYRVLELP
jgi:hypothetical protein